MGTRRAASRGTDAGPTESFFRELDERGRDPLLHGARGTVRFDLVDGGSVRRWYVAIDRGAVSVSHRAAKADAVVRLDRALFDRLATGRSNATAAVLRGSIVAEGDLGLLLSFQRLFPGPLGGRPEPPGDEEALS
jgi:putative sterol carrier protein